MPTKAIPSGAFGALFQEKLEELDEAARHDALMEHDEVELLRLRAAYLVSGTDGKPWQTGAARHYQDDVPETVVLAPMLDISYPAAAPRPSTVPDAGAPGSGGRQGRRATG